MNWSSHMLREGHRFQSSTQPPGKQWQILVLGLLPQQSSLGQLKYIPDTNSAHSAHATLTGKCHFFVQRTTRLCAQNIATNNLCVMILSKIYTNREVSCLCILQVRDKSDLINVCFLTTF